MDQISILFLCTPGAGHIPGITRVAAVLVCPSKARPGGEHSTRSSSDEEAASATLSQRVHFHNNGNEFRSLEGFLQSFRSDWQGDLDILAAKFDLASARLSEVRPLTSLDRCSMLLRKACARAQALTFQHLALQLT